MLPTGRYLHFKGNTYQVICIAKHSETEDLMVVYKSEKDQSIWVRPASMFTDQVEVAGTLKPRFQYIGK